MALSVLYSCCAGLDVHKETVVSCLLLTAPSGKVSKEIRTFGTTTSDLQALNTWLSQRGVTHVALESTGVYTLPTMLPKL
jgi:transposase